MAKTQWDIDAINEVRELLKMDFEDAAKWRGRKAEEYPGDARNKGAVETLNVLASTVDQVPANALIAYSELFNDGRDAKDHDEMLRRIGFSTTHATATEFVQEFLASRTTIHFSPARRNRRTKRFGI